MSKRGDTAYLQDIREALARIQNYVKGLNYEEFVKDIKTQDAVVRNLEIIGEAVKNVSKTLKGQYKNVAWREWAKVRDKLIHHYFGVNLDIVWSIVHESVLGLSKSIGGILARKS